MPAGPPEGSVGPLRYLLLAALCVLLAWPGSLACRRRDADSVEALKLADASALKRTFVTAHLDEPIRPGRSLVWCITMQLVWNQTKAWVGGDVLLEGDPPMAARLNASTVSSDDVDPASCIIAALSGPGPQSVRDFVLRQAADKFPGRKLDLPLTLVQPTGPYQSIQYSMLLKDLHFNTPFGKTNMYVPGPDGIYYYVRAFGIDVPDDPAAAPMRGQVRILDYVSNSDFIIELVTTEPDDRLLIARIPPSPTLRDLVGAVNQRVEAGAPEPLGPADRFRVPRFDFDLTRRYTEIEGRRYLNPGLRENRWVLQQALQTVNFILDEKGVYLKSEAVIVSGGCAAVAPLSGRLLDVRPPFLVMMKRSGRELPYFAMWIDNDELLSVVEQE
ncbi:MAG: hypothetical protein JW909_09955 [Planctomycetes bacterium]|nr:hypothetical protein [Planctomycetota bacterium]